MIFSLLDSAVMETYMQMKLAREQEASVARQPSKRALSTFLSFSGSFC